MPGSATNHTDLIAAGVTHLDGSAGGNVRRLGPHSLRALTFKAMDISSSPPPWSRKEPCQTSISVGSTF